MVDAPARPLSSLDALFAPTSVAVVGASDDRERLSGRPIRYLLEAGFQGRIYPINPKRTTVQGLPAFPSMGSLPETPDLALIVVPPIAAKDAIAECAARGVRGAYLLAGGFAERGEDGRRIQQDIAHIAAASGMRLLGPNCLGAFNSHVRFFGSFASSLERGLPHAGPVAIVSQSGAYGQHLAYLATRRGLGVRYLITTGNEVDIELAECVEWLVAQEAVKVILAYAEGLRDGPRLLRALDQATRAGKPVIVMKVGTSDVGARAAATHTAALAGSDAVFDAAIRQFGALRATTTETQVDMAYALSHAVPMAGPHIGIVSVSGGFGVQAADAAQQAGLLVPPLTAETRRQLAEVLHTGDVDNPIDVTGQAVNDLGMLQQALTTLGEHADIDAALVCLTTVPLAAALCGPLQASLVAGTRNLRARMPVALVMVADPPVVQSLEASGFLVFEDVTRAVTSLAAGATFSAIRAAARPATVATHAPCGVELTHDVSEVGAKSLLRAIGIATPEERLVASADEAVEAAGAIGFPVAMKIVSTAITHKTEVGGVRLGVQDPDAAHAAFHELVGRAAHAAPDARIDGVLVSAMAPPGVEVILGTTRDATFGPIVMFGLGGVMAELFDDVALRVAPIDATEARRMIDQTRAGALLRGWRGAPSADIDSVVRDVVALSAFASANTSQVSSIDINPLRVLHAGEGSLALDAALVRARP